MALRECRLLAFPKVLFPFPCSFFLGLAHARPFQEALTYSRSKMRAPRSDPGCAAPKSAMSSPHHGEARCDRRSRLGARCRRRVAQNGAVTNCSLARRRQRWVPYHANHGGRSQGVTRPGRLNRNRATTLWDARRNRRVVSRASPHAKIAMTIALFRLCSGPSAALFTVRRV
jgi:hypothetical protein